MKIGKCGHCGKPIRYEMVEVVRGCPKVPHGVCSNPECEIYSWETRCIETSPNDLDEDKAEEKVQDITDQIAEQNALVEKDLMEVLNPVEDKDDVNHPSHYTVGGIECIEAMRASMTEEAFKGYLKGCAQKYLWRYEKKANPKQDIEKAIWYLTKLKDELDDL